MSSSHRIYDINGKSRECVCQLFGKIVARRRRELELTQETLSERLPVERATIAMIESGHRFPELFVLFALAQSLNTSVSKLMEELEVVVYEGDASHA